MTKIKQMYNLLEEMVESAVKGDKEKVLELNEAYDRLLPKIRYIPDMQQRVESESPDELLPDISYIPKSLHVDYNFCVVYSLMSVIVPNLREESISLIKERFSKIPVPG